MKTIKLLAVSLTLLTTSMLSAQDCQLATAEATLDANNVTATLHPSGQLWGSQSDGGYIIPIPSSDGNIVNQSIMTGGLWIAGLDSGGNIKAAVSTYGSGGSTDFWPGIPNNNYIDEATCGNYDQLWSTNAQDISQMAADYADNGIMDDPIPSSALAWPAKGNPFFTDIHGFELPVSPGFDLAPFIDVNADGLYNPEDGDQPDIRDADQGVWWVFNDIGGLHTESGGDLNRIQVQALAYSYNSTDNNLNNTTFYEYDLYLFGFSPLNELYAGIWIDPDMGCFLDNKVGCVPEENLAYFYNSPNPNPGCTGENVTLNTPLVGIKMLQGLADEDNDIEDTGMSSFMYYLNGGVNPPPVPAQTDPSTALDYFRYLTGTWLDGAPLVATGSGYDPMSTDTTMFAFAGNPANPDDWTMCNEGSPAGDIRMIIGTGPVELEPSESKKIKFAVTHTYAAGSVDCPDVSVLGDIFDDLVLDTEELAADQSKVSFYPNPMSGNQAFLDFSNLKTPITQVQIFTVDGKMVQQYDQVSQNTLRIQRGNLSSGLYLYKALNQARQLYTGKFIIQ